MPIKILCIQENLEAIKFKLFRGIKIQVNSILDHLEADGVLYLLQVLFALIRIKLLTLEPEFFTVIPVFIFVLKFR